jgi:hypothetical protein
MSVGADAWLACWADAAAEGTWNLFFLLLFNTSTARAAGMVYCYSNIFNCSERQDDLCTITEGIY